MDRGAKRSAQCLKSEASRFRPRAGVAETDRLSVFRVTLAFSETSQLSLVLRGLGLMEGIAPSSVELCEASVAVNDVKRPSQFGQERDCWSPFRSERQERPAGQEVAYRL